MYREEKSPHNSQKVSRSSNAVRKIWKYAQPASSSILSQLLCAKQNNTLVLVWKSGAEKPLSLSFSLDGVSALSVLCAKIHVTLFTRFCWKGKFKSPRNSGSGSIRSVEVMRQKCIPHGSLLDFLPRQLAARCAVTPRTFRFRGKCAHYYIPIYIYNTAGTQHRINSYLLCARRAGNFCLPVEFRRVVREPS